MARNIPRNDSVAEMRQQLKTGVPAACILLFGEEVFLVEHFVSDLKDKVLDKDTKVFNEIIFEGKVRPEMIMDACETYPVFAERKLVIVKNSGLFKVNKKKKTEEKSTFAGTDEGPSNLEESGSTAVNNEDNHELYDEVDTDHQSVDMKRADEQKYRSNSSNQESIPDTKVDWKAFFENFPKHTLLVFRLATLNLKYVYGRLR